MPSAGATPTSLFEKLWTHIQASVEMSEEDFRLVTDLIVPKKLRKRQYLLQAGDVCTRVAFVTKGCLRQYELDDLGRENILTFAAESSWMTDLESFRAHKPTTHNIDALEDSELLLLDNTSIERLSVTVPALDRYFNVVVEQVFQEAIRRISDFVGTSAEDRYLHFLSMYPGLSQRIPLHQIASFLGITPQTLSRIRRDLATRS